MAKTVANLSDVASFSGVSKSTVSRVLNNKLGNGFTVREIVRKKILNAAKVLNYRPNLIAKTLTEQRSRMISVLGGAHALSDLGNIYQTVINSVTRVFDNISGGFDVIVDMSHHKPDVSHLPAWKIDGAVILAQTNERTAADLSERGVPFVIVNGKKINGGSSVTLDDVHGMRLAIQHLLELGHRKIAYANAPDTRLDGHSSVAERHQTYINQMSKHELSLIAGHDRPLTSAVDFINEAVISHEATAVISYGHMNALNIMQAAHSLGLAIPQDFSLICFCDEYAANVMSPNLTFIDLQSRKMGNVASEMLLTQTSSREKLQPKHLKLQEKLVVRETTAEPRVR